MRFKSLIRFGTLGLLAAVPLDAQETVDPALFSGLTYRNVGPSRGGRVTAVAGHRAHPRTFYMGATGGGVWKTTDAGHTWNNISDGFFATASIGAIRVADSDPDIVYVGTGSDGIRSNVITGKGVYRSDDAGRTWRHIGLERTGQIGAVEIHPTNPNVVFVAAIGNAFSPNPERGVYRTTNGGQSWEQVLFVSDSTGSSDLDFAPDDPNTIYAHMWRGERKPWTIISGAYEGGSYKSTDGGDTWTKMTNGLPRELVGKGDFAVSPASPDRVYLLVEALPGGGVYRSDDRGENWVQMSDQASLVDRPFYYTNIDADPTNADIVYVNSTRYFRSTDGGGSWELRRTPHGDNHDQWMNPDNPDIYIQSNDGGANVTLDGGETWSSQHNQVTAELYQVNVDDQFPYWLYAGQQDNSTIMVPSLPPRGHPAGREGYWQAIGGCETGPAIPKPGNANIVYSNCKGRFGRFNMTTGQEKQYYVGAANMYGHNPSELQYRFQRVAPIYVSPHNADVVYHLSQFVHRSTDEGVTWETISEDLTAFTPETQVISGAPITRDITGEEFYSTLYTISESPITEGVIWVGAADGPVHVSRDNGATWMDVTPNMPSGGRVQTIEASPHDPAKAYVAVLRYMLDDWTPHIYRTNDFGRSWTKLTTGSNGMPNDHPTRVIREDPDRAGLLYAGTEFGMFVSFDDGDNWQSFQQNLPVTPITDLKVFRKDLVMSTMGRSFWIMDNLTPLHQIADAVANADAHLFEPRDAYRMRFGGFGGFGPRDPADPEFPQAGAMIDYYFADAPSGEVTLEFFDAEGTLVRAFSSEAMGEEDVVPAEPSMREFRLERVGTPRLPTQAGMNRFIWDLRLPGPWAANPRMAGRNGPAIVPGAYSAKLTVGDWSQTQSFEIHMDPRVTADGVTQAVLEQQLNLALQVRDALSQGRMAVAQIDAVREDFERGDNASARARLDEISKALSTASGRYMTPMLVDQLSYLYSMINRADQEPGRDAYLRFDTLNAELQVHLRNLERLLRTTADR